MSKKATTAYLPTVHGRPAVFSADYQLCVGGGKSFHVVPVRSLAQVRRQIAASVSNRMKDGLEVDPADYSYVRIRLSNGEA